MNDLKQISSFTGWILNLKKIGFLTFFDLLPATGQQSFQVVIRGEENSKRFAHEVSVGDLVEVSGYQKERLLKDSQQKSISSQEVLLSSWRLINSSSLLPFENKDELTLKDSTRYKYRYIDLRRNKSKIIIELKSKLFFFVRNFLHQQGFKEIDTPILSPFSPEGAQTLLVPSEREGYFYTLSQSPQIFKQILMISGFGKYYQIAKTFRREDARSNRQIEFLQLDIEASLLSSQQILALCEKMISQLIVEVFGISDSRFSFERKTFQQAIEKYGTDKPDLRIPLEITKIEDIDSQNYYYLSVNKVLVSGKVVNWEQIRDLFTNNSSVNFSIYEFNDTEDILLSGQQLSISLLTKLKKLHHNCFVVFLQDEKSLSLKLLSEIRLKLGKQLNSYQEGVFRFVWITDWPLFEYSNEKKLVSSRHPFTLPQDKFINLIKNANASQYQIFTDIISDSFDLVCNGEELASGSQRIYDHQLQRKIFEILGFDSQQIKNNFSYFLDALSFGAPPHGGIGFGIERIIMILLNISNIKETIPFPKNIDGSCSLTGAPNKLQDK